jgi:hypothetical protein
LVRGAVEKPEAVVDSREADGGAGVALLTVDKAWMLSRRRGSRGGRAWLNDGPCDGPEADAGDCGVDELLFREGLFPMAVPLDLLNAEMEQWR